MQARRYSVLLIGAVLRKVMRGSDPESIERTYGIPTMSVRKWMDLVGITEVA